MAPNSVIEPNFGNSSLQQNLNNLVHEMFVMPLNIRDQCMVIQYDLLVTLNVPCKLELRRLRKKTLVCQLVFMSATNSLQQGLPDEI